MSVRGAFSRIISLLLLAGLLLAGCQANPSSAPGVRGDLTVLAGSELKDLEPLFDEIKRNTGLSLEMRYVGSLDGAERLMAGEETDLAWFSHGKYLTLLESASKRVATQEKIMLSPVVLGVEESKARAWGWVNNAKVTWRDVVDKAKTGELRYAMTNPASSNTGFTALMGVAAALAGSSDAISVAQIDQVGPALQDFFKGQALTAGSSGWLAESYVQQQDQLDGMINYESVLLKLNKQGQLRERLYLVYPQEGIVTADYPLMLINPAKRAEYDRLVAYLRSPEFQQKLMESTLRRPVIPQVRLSKDFPTQLLVELPFPNSREVIDALLFAYLDEQRVPAHAFFVLDVSGSMAGTRMRDLKAAMSSFTGADASLTGQFARFRDRERITIVTFNGQVQPARDFYIDLNDPRSLQAIRDFIDSLQADGGTALYSALQRAYELAQAAKQREPDRYYSIVLMSDGQKTAGISEKQFLDYYRKLPEGGRSIKTFTVLFGDADKAAMENIAKSAGGRMFDAKSESLGAILKEIRGYQ